MGHQLPWKIETVALGSALGQKGWRWKGPPAGSRSPGSRGPCSMPFSTGQGGGAACPQVPSAPPRPGASGARVTPPPGCGHPHPSSSQVQELGLSLSPVCFTLAVLLGGIRVHTSVPPLPWFLPLIFPAAPEASPPPGLWAPWLHPHSQDLQVFFHFWKCGLLTMTASFLLCCSYKRLILQPHPGFLVLICSAVPPSRLASFLMGPPSHSPSHTAFLASISEGQGEHTGIILLRKKRFIFSGNSESQD